MRGGMAALKGSRDVLCGRDVPEQRRFRVVMISPDGKVVVYLNASSRLALIDQMENRRLPTPPGMTGFEVMEVA